MRRRRNFLHEGVMLQKESNYPPPRRSRENNAEEAVATSPSVKNPRQILRSLQLKYSLLFFLVTSRETPQIIQGEILMTSF